MAHLLTGQAPTQLGGFEILRRLGAGGMAEVFVAKKRGAEGTYKILVLKRILPTHGTSRRFRTMFVEEAQLATRLNHPNIVQVYEFQDYGDAGLLLSMEYVEGPDLGRLMSAAKAKGIRLPPWVGAHIIAEAAKGLHYAHERREGGVALEIVHRDVSPQNILLSYEGAVKIADFGIAKASLFREESGVLKGKFGYMSPEQARGEKVDRRSDIYSLGVVLHELLTLRFLHGTLKGDELLEAVRAGVVEPPSTFVRDVPAELDAIVMRALARDPGARFQTARDMSAAIARALFARQELVDAAAVEATIAQVVGRDEVATGVSDLPPSIADQGSLALPAIDPRSLAQPPGAPGPETSGDTDVGNDKTGEGRARKPERTLREVRHVAILTLRLSGFEELEQAIGLAGTARAADRIRATLDDIAYKRGAHWTWEPNYTARAAVGLMANPGRAASDSAWLAIDVHEALAGASEDLPSPIRASIGIVRGVATGTRDPLGHLVQHSVQEPANTLARLVGERAPIGRTWVAGGLYRLVRREFRWGDAPTVEVPAEEGAPPALAPASMRIYALERPLTREERLAELALAPSDLVGREAEKADLHAGYHVAVAGDGQLICRAIVGEMGIGKSALVATFLTELPPNARVLRAECSPARTELPFGVLAELVREATGTNPEQSLEEVIASVVDVLGPLGGGESARAVALSLAELVTGRREREAEDDDQPYRRRLMFGLRRLLAALAARQPLVVILEGMQWGDHPGLELISKLLRRKERLPVFAILMSRPDERAAPYLEGHVRIDLKGLSPDEQIRLLQLRLGVKDGVTEVAADLMPKAAGNPFFLLEMIDALLERGGLEIREKSDGEHALVRIDRPGDRSEPLPSTLEQLIGERLAELPPQEHVIVDWLAVAGGALTTSDLLTLARLEADEPLVRLLARGVCDRKGDEIDFRYPLARDVAYIALDPAERTRMHRRLGEHLSRTPMAKGASAALVARHLARGGAPEQAAVLFLEAAAAARINFQSKLAIRHYQRALSLLPHGDSRRLIAHEALENIYRTLGRRRERRRHLLALRALARELRQPKWVALSLTRTARLDLDEGLLARGLPLAQKAETVARAAKVSAIEVEAQSILSGLLRELGDIQGALAACDRALETAAARPDVPPRARAEVLQSRGILLRRLGRVREAVDSFAEAIAVFRRTGARRQEARAKNSLAFAMFLLERFEDAIALALASIRIDLAIGGRFQVAKTLTTIGRCYARLGDIPRSLAYLKRAREAHEHYRDQDSRAETLLASAEVLIEAGDLDAAHVFCGDAAALNAVTGNAYDSVYERIVRAQLSRAAGDSRGAAVIALEARRAAETQALLSFNLIATALEAIARVEIGEAYSGVLLASNALGAVDEVQGTEYGLAIRALCADALTRAGSPQADAARKRAASHARTIVHAIRDERLKEFFLARPMVAELIGADETGAPPSEGPASAQGSTA